MKRMLCTWIAILTLLMGCGSVSDQPSIPDTQSSSISESGLSSDAAVPSNEAVQTDGVIANDSAPNSSLPTTQEFISQLVQEHTAQFAQPDMGEYEKVKAAYDYLIGLGHYTRPIALDIWRIRSQGDHMPSYVETRSLNMLLFGFGTCEDFAASLMMLLEELGIDTRYMTGMTYTRGGGMTYHSWIQAKVDGIWYHLDVELDDGISSDDGMVNYRYFMKGDATMRGSHFWGQGLIDYAGDRLQSEQITEIREEYMGKSCSQDYPTPAAEYIAVNPRPDTDALRIQLLEELREFEAVYGTLQPIEQNIYPPVFVRYWHENSEQPADDYGNLVRNAAFIREYPQVRLLKPPVEEVAAAATGNSTPITITAGDTVITAELDDSDITREFLSQLPQTIPMSRIRTREFYGPIERPLVTQAPVQTTFANGDVAYWFSGESMCLFYADEDTDGTVSSGIMKLGRITSDLSALAQFDDPVEMVVAIAPKS